MTPLAHILHTSTSSEPFLFRAENVSVWKLPWVSQKFLGILKTSFPIPPYFIFHKWPTIWGFKLLPINLFWAQQPFFSFHLLGSI